MLASDIFKAKFQLKEFTKKFESFLNSEEPLPNPIEIDILLESNRNMDMLVNHIIDNNDFNLAEEILKIDMTIWEQMKVYLDLNTLPPIKLAWKSLRLIQSFEEKVEMIKAYYQENKREFTEETQNISKDAEPQQRELIDLLPEQLKNEEAVEIFLKAIEAQLIEHNPEGLKWKETKQLLSLFSVEMSEKFKMGKGEKRIAWKPFEELFKMKNLRRV